MEQFRICKDCDFPGVYAILNMRNNKIYVGSSKNIKKRLHIHKSRLKSDSNSAKRMQEDYNNGDNFISFVVTPVRFPERDDLKYFEDKAITRFSSYNRNLGYNGKSAWGMLKEESNIVDADRIMSTFFSSSENEKEQTINKWLNTEWRF